MPTSRPDPTTERGFEAAVIYLTNLLDQGVDPGDLADRLRSQYGPIPYQVVNRVVNAAAASTRGAGPINPFDPASYPAVGQATPFSSIRQGRVEVVIDLTIPIPGTDRVIRRRLVVDADRNSYRDEILREINNAIDSIRNQSPNLQVDYQTQTQAEIVRINRGSGV